MSWKFRKKENRRKRRLEIDIYREYQAKEYVNHVAPYNMSFIDNTVEVINYFDNAHALFQIGDKVEFNIKHITNLTPDTITLMIAKLHDTKFTLKNLYRGEAPEESYLRKIFLESGFYNFVASSKENKRKTTNLLHKENDYRVRPDIAKSACIFGINHSLGINFKFSPLYEILIECMQNTNNHASLEDDEKCKWWLFVYNCKESGVTKYSFLDLGVGIFQSMEVKGLFRKFGRGVGVINNLDFVSSLLDGKLQSRIEKDNKIRGKGIPQIVKLASLDEFLRFEIVTNDIKIDLKKGNAVKIKSAFNGTFYYWEIRKNEF